MDLTAIKSQSPPSGHSPVCPSVKPGEIPLCDSCGCQGTLPSVVPCSPPHPFSFSFHLSSSSQLPPQLCPLAVIPLLGACPVCLAGAEHSHQDGRAYCIHVHTCSGPWSIHIIRRCSYYWISMLHVVNQPFSEKITCWFKCFRVKKNSALRSTEVQGNK